MVKETVVQKTQVVNGLPLTLEIVKFATRNNVRYMGYLRVNTVIVAATSTSIPNMFDTVCELLDLLWTELSINNNAHNNFNKFLPLS